ncbi:ATP adenylyltransferase-domain-containing protein [Hyaloraphidium curvatum]|nr:ATP adenylyltransferase-domain-containing protein [Hyaloraphidium curvatum]
MGSLRSSVQKVFDRALADNALIWHQSKLETVESGGVKFQIRLVPSLAKKPKLGGEKPASEKPSNPKPFNPFLPPDPALLVTKLGDYNVVLNKFCVNRDHFILATSDYRIQNELLRTADLAAIWTCLSEWDDDSKPLLVFHNCGPLSGASQPHKHVQAIPSESGIPIEEAISRAAPGRPAAGPFALPEFAFHHRVILLPDGVSDPEQLKDVYRTLVAAAFGPLEIDLSVYDGVDVAAERMDPSIPSHNLLLTKRWMMCVPRRAETFGGLGVNSVGFAGWLLATDEDQMRNMKASGPMSVLQNLAYKL